MSLLPNELLTQLLSLVPAGEFGESLLALRLVCRRWKELIETSAAVWRRRTVSLCLDRDGNVRGGGVLRVAPELGRLEVTVESGVSPANARRILEKLKHCQTKVRALMAKKWLFVPTTYFKVEEKSWVPVPAICALESRCN